MIHAAIHDLKESLRSLRRTPAFSLTAIVILAVSIGLNAAVFTLARAALFNGFRFVKQNDRILYIHSQNNGRYSGVSYADFEDWRQAQSLTGIGAVADVKLILNDEHGLPERYTATRITTNGFRLLGQRPLLGRDFEESDAQPGAPPVAILEYSFWAKRFASDPAVVGQTLRIQGSPATVIGVMREGFSFPQNEDFWLPLIQTPDLRPRNARSLWFAFGRMADGVGRAKVQTELESIGHRLANEFPETNRDQIPLAETFSSFFIGSNAPLIFGALWGSAGFVLLAACANLANLMLARAIGRSRETSIRIALGAGRWRILRQTIFESLTLAIVGSALGWFLARSAIRAYEAAVSPSAADWNHGLLNYAMDGHVLAYLIGAVTGAALLFGLGPALRLSSLDPQSGMQDSTRGAAGSRSQHRLSGIAVMCEVALACVLLTGAGVMVRSFLAMANASLGIRPERTVDLLLHLPQANQRGVQARNALFDRLTAGLETIPGIEAASTGPIPGEGSLRRIPFEVSGLPLEGAEHRPTAGAAPVGRGYFKALGTAILTGRDFESSDADLGIRVAIVNERLAREVWPGQNALGRRLRFWNRGQPEDWLTIVGVASNVIYDRARQEIAPVVYLPAAQVSGFDEPWFLARTSLSAGALSGAIRKELAAVDPGIVVWLGPYDLAERLASSGFYGNVRTHAVLLLVFASIALALSGLGLYTACAHSVTHRTRELGIRLALGATRLEILTMVMKQGLLQVGAGLALGLLVSGGVDRILRSELVHVTPSDPATIATASMVLVLAAAAGCLIPARRAIRIDPAESLRHE